MRRGFQIFGCSCLFSCGLAQVVVSMLSCALAWFWLFNNVGSLGFLLHYSWLWVSSFVLVFGF